MWTTTMTTTATDPGIVVAEHAVDAGILVLVALILVCALMALSSACPHPPSVARPVAAA
jgi:hypothetical protein